MAGYRGIGEGQFRLAWPRWQPPPDDGVVAMVREPCSTRGWVDALLAREPGLRYVWTSTENDCGVSGLDITSVPGVLAVTMAPAGADTRHLALALEAAYRLATKRWAGAHQPSRACLTSWAPPPPHLSPGMVRVPHLVTVCHGHGLATDSVVWEVLSPEDARRWLGGPLPDCDRRFVEEELDELVRLRGAVRRGELPATAAAARLLSLMPRDGDLPVELVYQRPDIFRALMSLAVPVKAAPWPT